MAVNRVKLLKQIEVELSSIKDSKEDVRKIRDLSAKIAYSRFPKLRYFLFKLTGR